MRPTGVKTRLYLSILVVALAAGACGGAGADAGNADSIDASVACSANVNDVSFPARYLDGPELNRNELLATDAGKVLEELFVGGEAELEGGQFRESDGFSVVSEELVLGYKAGAVTWFFSLDETGVRSWGGCNPTHTRDDQVTARWTPAGHVPAEATTFPIYVEGGACSTENGNEITTVIENILVAEKLDRVEVTVWTSERSLDFEFCAGVGISIDAEVQLESPLGDRTLVDAGAVPAISHQNPHQIEAGRFTYSCGSDVMQASVYDHLSDVVGEATPDQALQTFPLTTAVSIEHFLIDDMGTDTVYGYTDAAANLVATVTLLYRNDSWLIGATEQCDVMP